MPFDLSSEAARGMSVKTKLKLYPRIARAYAMYLQCRELQFIHFKFTKNRKQEHKVVPQVVGFHTLPEAGGLLDQPNWTIEMFSAFKAGENHGSSKAIK